MSTCDRILRREDGKRVDLQDWADAVGLLENWSGRPGSNRRHPAWEAGVLPLNYSRSKELTSNHNTRVAYEISSIPFIRSPRCGSRFADPRQKHATALNSKVSLTTERSPRQVEASPSLPCTSGWLRMSISADRWVQPPGHSAGPEKTALIVRVNRRCGDGRGVA